MQAVILAGGLGTRLRPVTERVPKVLLPVRGEPFIVHLLRLLKKNGIVDIVLCVGHLGEQVRHCLGNGEAAGVSLKYSLEEGKLLGTGGALRQARDLLDEHFYVMNGDTYLPIAYKAVEGSFIACGKKALIIVYNNADNTGVSNNVELDDGLVVRHQKGGADARLRYVDCGVLILIRGVLDMIENGASVSLEAGLYPSLIQQRELAAYVTSQRFYDIGTPERLRLFEEFVGRARQ